MSSTPQARYIVLRRTGKRVRGGGGGEYLQ